MICLHLYAPVCGRRSKDVLIGDEVTSIPDTSKLLMLIPET